MLPGLFVLPRFLLLMSIKAPEDVRRVLSEADRFFKEERVSAGTVLYEDDAASDKLYFIGSGSVELQVNCRLALGEIDSTHENHAFWGVQ